MSFSPSPLVPPDRDFNQGISQASCPEAAEHSYTQCPTVLPPAFGTLVCTVHRQPVSLGPATTSSQSIPERGQRAPVWECLSVCFSPCTGNTISPSPCLTPAWFPAPSCQVYPAFSSSPPPAPRLSGHVCISVSCRLSSPYTPPCLLPTPSSPRGSVLSQS